ncbi:hypothetical protein VNO77_01700 [Canavalia gladiata]|uniref:Uncharacterized protein n=1 Tax=Canavalia gladiata TaxID=3824 RepID=A0AAN9R2D1_CANGL
MPWCSAAVELRKKHMMFLILADPRETTLNCFVLFTTLPNISQYAAPSSSRLSCSSFVYFFFSSSQMKQPKNMGMYLEDYIFGILNAHISLELLFSLYSRDEVEFTIGAAVEIVKKSSNINGGKKKREKGKENSGAMLSEYNCNLLYTKNIRKLFIQLRDSLRAMLNLSCIACVSEEAFAPFSCKQIDKLGTDPLQLKIKYETSPSQLVLLAFD